MTLETLLRTKVNTLFPDNTEKEVSPLFIISVTENELNELELLIHQQYIDHEDNTLYFKCVDNTLTPIDKKV